VQCTPLAFSFALCDFAFTPTFKVGACCVVTSLVGSFSSLQATVAGGRCLGCLALSRPRRRCGSLSLLASPHTSKGVELPVLVDRRRSGNCAASSTSRCLSIPTFKSALCVVLASFTSLVAVASCEESRVVSARSRYYRAIVISLDSNFRLPGY
jgi:hypothetical protein